MQGSTFLREHSLSIALTAALITLDFAWNANAGIVWTVPLWITLFPFYLFILGAVLLAITRGGERRYEIALYLTLWAVFSAFAARLSYLASTFNFPLRDSALARIDNFLGFDWAAWHAVAMSNKALFETLSFAYRTFTPQPIAIVIVVSAIAPRGRNREFFVATFLALLITTALAIVLPAYGPTDTLSGVSQWRPMIDARRAGQRPPMPYIGIVTFPSFHACMAVIYMVSMRGHRLGLAIAAALNVVMLVSTMPIGKHYLVDVIAGIGVAAIAVWLAPLVIDGWGLRLTPPRAPLAAGYLGSPSPPDEA